MKFRGFLIALAFFCTGAFADTFPSKPIRIIAGFPPGGGADRAARLIATQLAARLGQPVFIENRPGASGVIASDLVARSAADGYTLLLVPPNHATNVKLVARLPYDTQRSFSPVASLVTAPYVLAVSSALPARTVSELLAYIKRNPHAVNAGAPAGGMQHIAMSMLKAEVPHAGMQVVLYKGASAVLPDLLAGRIALAFDSYSSIGAHVRSGAVRALAVTSQQRFRQLPDVPTFAESGYPGFVVTSWLGLVAPASTPPAIISKLNAEVNAVLGDTALARQLADSGDTIWTSTAPEFGRFIDKQITDLGKVIIDSGISITN